MFVQAVNRFEHSGLRGVAGSIGALKDSILKGLSSIVGLYAVKECGSIMELYNIGQSSWSNTSAVKEATYSTAGGCYYLSSLVLRPNICDSSLFTSRQLALHHQCPER